jgi:hypothetical protein
MTMSSRPLIWFLSTATLVNFTGWVHAQEPVLPIRIVEHVAPSSEHGLRPSADFQPVWVWSKNPGDSPLRLEQVLYLEEKPNLAELQVIVDDEFEAYLNGNPVSKGTQWTELQRTDVTCLLKKGRNVLRLDCRNANASSAAGAIAVLRIKNGKDVMVAGTSHSTTVTYNCETLPSSKIAISTADSEPWNVFTPEEAQNAVLRQEVDKLKSAIRGPDSRRAAKAIGYLAQFAVDHPKLDLFEPTFTLTPETNVKPDPQSNPLLNEALKTIICNLHPEKHSETSKLCRQAATAAVYVLVANAEDTKLVLQEVESLFCQTCADQQSIQLAVLNGLLTRIALDETEFRSAPQKAKDEKEKNLKQITDQIAAIDKTSKEIVELNKRITALNEVKLTTPPALPAPLAPPPAAPPAAVTAAVTAINKVFDLLLKRVEDEQKRLESLQQVVIPEPSVSEAARTRLSDITTFIQDKTCGVPTGIASSLAQQIVFNIDNLRRSYDNIESRDNADAFFKLVKSSSKDSVQPIGAVTSAADRSGVASGFTSGERPGVSTTAPFDPQTSSKRPPLFPVTDDRGQRMRRDTSGNVDNEFRIAPGAKGATEPTGG